MPLAQIPPACPYCHGLIRPGVVWFGEALDPDVLDTAEAAADCDVFLTVGTSSVVYPAASFVEEARRRGAFIVEVNPEATPGSDAADLVVRRPAEVALPEVDALAKA